MESDKGVPSSETEVSSSAFSPKFSLQNMQNSYLFKRLISLIDTLENGSRYLVVTLSYFLTFQMNLFF